MKRISIVLFFSAAMAFAQEAAPKAPAKSAPKKTTAVKAKAKAAPKQNSNEIPAGAKEFEPGKFRWVNAKGESWIYTRTPFGIMKGIEPKEPTPDPVPTDWTVTEQGDQLTFERPWPFGGTRHWTKSKSDLTEMEMAVWKRIQESKAK